MPYTWITRAQFRSALQGRLANTAFWSTTELDAILTEVLRTWNTLTLYWRDRGTWNTTASTPFYDLATLVTAGDGTKLLGRTTTDRNLVNDMQYALLEPANDWGVSSVWAGTDMFNMDDLQSALQRRRNQWLFDTGQVLSFSKTTYAPTSRIPLDEAVIDVRRAAWITLDGSGNEAAVFDLPLTDEFTLARQFPQWVTTPGTPRVASLSVTPNIQLQLAPIPNDTGKLHLITVNNGVNLDVTAGVAVGVLQDFTPYLKWGALADLLAKDGPANDVERSRYCEQRYQEGVVLSSIFATVLNCEVNGQAVQSTDVTTLDRQIPGWQGSATGTPQQVAFAGHNLIALFPVPVGGESITMDVVRNAPIPAADGDNLQFGKELLDTMLGECVHIAMFKCGGAEFQSTLELHNRFIRAAAEMNEKLKANAQEFAALASASTGDDRRNPRREAA